MSSASPPEDAWSLAKARMLGDVTLSAEERKMLQTSTIKDVVDEVQSLDKEHAIQSKSRRVMAYLDPLLKTLERFGPALNVFTQGRQHLWLFPINADVHQPTLMASSPWFGEVLER